MIRLAPVGIVVYLMGLGLVAGPGLAAGPDLADDLVAGRGLVMGVANLCLFLDFEAPFFLLGFAGGIEECWKEAENLTGYDRW
jgi:hypothetical protein